MKYRKIRLNAMTPNDQSPIVSESEKNALESHPHTVGKFRFEPVESGGEAPVVKAKEIKK